MQTLYPWQKNYWQNVQHMVEQKRLPHAILMHGPDGLGICQFAEYLSAYLLCSKSADNGPCGCCHNCRLQKSGNHPDIYHLRPSGQGKQIKVSEIRAAINFLALTRHTGNYQIVMIEEAQMMNNNAINALLKTLEEPPNQSLLILIAQQITLLPVTLRSRCQQIAFQCPNIKMVIAWLKEQGIKEPKQLSMLSGKGPLRALDMLQNGFFSMYDTILLDLEALLKKAADPIKIAGKWHKLGQNKAIECLSYLSMDLLYKKCIQVGQSQTEIDNLRMVPTIETIINSLSLTEILANSVLAQHNLVLINKSGSANELGTLEELALSWQNIQNNCFVKN